VLVEIDAAVATVTLNRPEVRNAISSDLRRALHEAMVALEGDDEVQVVILTGADPAFCAGLDLRELGSAEGGLGGGDPAVGSTRPFPPLTKPLIGAVNGAAITGGFELALNCDFLIASDRAVFADTHARVGVMPGWGLSALLAAAVGVRRAREISLTGNFVTAPEARDWGLVNRVVAHEDLLPTVRGLAADIVGNDETGVRRMLATYGEAEEAALADAWRLEGEAARAFRADVGFDVAEVERRRQGIIERGRTQI
ncbi:MAG: enoyl-CoA hydratase, partial [Actinomycetota bacterium]